MLWQARRKERKGEREKERKGGTNIPAQDE